MRLDLLKSFKVIDYSHRLLHLILRQVQTDFLETQTPQSDHQVGEKYHQKQNNEGVGILSTCIKQRKIIEAMKKDGHGQA